jgi:hypothetical protein
LAELCLQFLRDAGVLDGAPGAAAVLAPPAEPDGSARR